MSSLGQVAYANILSPVSVKISCGHCGSSSVGAQVLAWAPALAEPTISPATCLWVMCSNCYGGSVVYHGAVIPKSKHGANLENLPNEIKEAYEEVRKCMSVGAFTASELICRKILMYVAVNKGAKAEKNKNFVQYLDDLKPYIAPNMQDLVDMIRKNGNDSAHELATPDRERAERTFKFTAHLLTSVYEM